MSVLLFASALLASTLSYIDPFIGTEGVGSQYGGMQPYTTVPFGSIHVVPQTRQNAIGRLSYNAADTNLLGIILTRQPAIWMGDWGWTTVTLPKPCPIESIVSRPERTVVKAGGRTLEWTATGCAAWIRGDLQGVALASGVNRERQDEHLGYPLKNFGSWYHVERVDAHNLKIGVSLLSEEQAAKNLAAEMPAGVTFEAIAAATRRQWEDAFARVEIDAPEDVKKIFYTGLFHTLLYPRRLDEDGRYYSAFDDRVHTLKPNMKAYYNCYSLWDTYRAEHPLLTLIQPERVSDMMNALLTMYEEGGWLPKWPNPGYTGIMIGSPAEVVLAEAYVKGFGGIDWNLAYAAVKKNATVPQTNDRTFAWEDRGRFGRTPETRGGLARYMELGYVAGDETAESVSRTQDFCLDDLSAAILADATGHADDAAYFRRRAKNYTNLWNAAEGAFLPRAANGAFMKAKEGLKVKGHMRSSYCEQSPHTAIWALPFDTEGLAALVGGNEQATRKLDDFFDRLFWVPERGNKSIHGNEPSHHCAYLYNRFGHPEKTQQRVREIMTRAYSTNRKGFDGNEDCGQMSAWYVFSALGFYPIDSATGEYELGSPIVRHARIRFAAPYKPATLEIRVTNYAPDRWRVREVRLNGKVLANFRVRHADLVKGSVLEFVMEAESVRIAVDPTVSEGPVKPVNSVGQPPMNGKLSNWSMMHYLKEAGIPYARLHDVGGWLGGGLFVDIPNLFPNFDADENDPVNYRFAYTDSLITALIDNNVEPWFRLGITIENWAGDWAGFHALPPLRSMPPKDFAKWARICEHVVRHYTQGWANGFRHRITYWEIWNEPDLEPNPPVSMTWQAPFSEYCRLYGVAATHLKKCFPQIKIGGPASCGFYASGNPMASPRTKFHVACANEFLDYVKKHNLPLDFFSFHSYAEPAAVRTQIAAAEAMLAERGLKAETWLNEWLCCVSHASLGTARQASGIAAEMLMMQNSTLSGACIYDARCGVGAYSPLFNPMTYKPHKAYYVFTAFNELRKLGTAVKVTCSNPAVYASAAAKDGKVAVMLANPSNREMPFVLDFPDAKGLRCRLTDDTHTDASVALPSALPPHSFLIGVK